MTQLQYYNGSAWVTAVVGAQGQQGYQGPQGNQGAQGVTGAQGTTGGAGGAGYSTGGTPTSGVNTNPHGYGGDGGSGQVRITY